METILDFKITTCRNPAEGRRQLGSVAQDDPRLADERAPRSHRHTLHDIDGPLPASYPPEPIIIQNGPPSLPPNFVGQRYIDLLNTTPYMAVGTNLATEWVSILGSQIGSGSPEGIVSAPPGARYFDSVGNQDYVKTTGYGNTGWL